MESYINAPEIHAAAARNPRFIGGPFINYSEERVNEIEALLRLTKESRSSLFELSTALSEVTHILANHEHGYSLQYLYPEIPYILRGFVELVYDLNRQPSFRIVEPLLYKSKYYQPSAQSLMISLSDRDERPFALSTPRLDDPGVLHVAAPFSGETASRIYRMDTDPLPMDDICSLLQAQDDQRPLISSFLTSRRSTRYKNYDGRRARWRYFGHACVLVEAAGTSILLDPVISYEDQAGIPRYSYSDLPDEIDYVLITHNHQDHIMFETLLRLKSRIRHVVVPLGGGAPLQDPSLKLILRQIGFDNIIEIGELDTIETKSGSITGIPFWGEHADLDIRSKSAYLVTVGRHRLMFCADSCNIEPRLYEHVRNATGSIDALFLGMECDGAPLSWLYGPLLAEKLNKRMDDSRRLAGCNFQEAIDIVRRFSSREVYVYAMGQEPWLSHVMGVKYTAESRPITESDRLIKECLDMGIRAERLYGEREMFLDDYS
jgi:L-ascorbate metabolism protein UlaG (beta-lactamase superfamily)